MTPFLALLTLKKNLLLVDHAFAHVTPTLFVVFITFTAFEQQSPSFPVECKFVIYAVLVETPVFLLRTKARFTKDTAFDDPDSWLFWTFFPGPEGNNIVMFM